MFKEDILKPLGGQCPKCLKQKVQCTCHTMFKVGDWVRVPRTGLIIKLSENEVKYGEVILADSLYKEKDLELWQPKEGEHVWFWDKCTPHRPTLREFGDTKKADDGQWYYTDSEQNPYECCEPFVYDKPSIFKG